MKHDEHTKASVDERIESLSAELRALRREVRRQRRSRWWLLLLGAACLIPLTTLAVPAGWMDFAAGTTISASDMSARFRALWGAVEGNAAAAGSRLLALEQGAARYTDWAPFDPVIEGVVLEVGKSRGRWRREGDTLHMRVSLVPTSVTGSIVLVADLGDGPLEIDSAKSSGKGVDGTSSRVGPAYLFDPFGSYVGVMEQQGGTARFAPTGDDGAYKWDPSVPIMWNGDEEIFLEVVVPIAGW